MPLTNDPDAAVVALFKQMAMKDEAKSRAAGRPIFDDVEIVELRYAGSKNVSVFPALEFCRYVDDPETGERQKQSYAERFQRQYRQFKARDVQTKSGTPLDWAPFLTEAKRAELRALNIYTVEALAALDGTELKNLGPGGREWKNHAIEYIDEAKRGAPNAQMMAEIEALRARNEILEEDLKHKQEIKAKAAASEFDDMSTPALKAFIAEQTGVAPQGNVSRKTLVRMAQEARVPDEAA